MQVSLNLKEKRLERAISGEYVNGKEHDDYDSFEEIVNDMKYWSFDNLVENHFDYEELEQKETKEQKRALKKESREVALEM